MQSMWRSERLRSLFVATSLLVLCGCDSARKGAEAKPESSSRFDTSQVGEEQPEQDSATNEEPVFIQDVEGVVQYIVITGPPEPVLVVEQEDKQLPQRVEELEQKVDQVEDEAEALKHEVKARKRGKDLYNKYRYIDEEQRSPETVITND